MGVEVNFYCQLCILLLPMNIESTLKLVCIEWSRDNAGVMKEMMGTTGMGIEKRGSVKSEELRKDFVGGDGKG